MRTLPFRLYLILNLLERPLYPFFCNSNEVLFHRKGSDRPLLVGGNMWLSGGKNLA